MSDNSRTAPRMTYLHDEVLLVVVLPADGAGVVLAAVHGQVPDARGQGAEAQPALPAPGLR